MCIFYRRRQVANPLTLGSSLIGVRTTGLSHDRHDHGLQNSGEPSHCTCPACSTNGKSEKSVAAVRPTPTPKTTHKTTAARGGAIPRGLAAAVGRGARALTLSLGVGKVLRANWLLRVYINLGQPRQNSIGSYCL